jgi:hypothetical protein
LILFFRLSNGSSTSDQLEDQDYYRQNQQQVNESTHRIAANKTEQPKHQKNYKDCPKHNPSLFFVRRFYQFTPIGPSADNWPGLAAGS